MVLWQLLRARGALQTTRDRTLGHGRVGGQAVPGSYNGPPGAYAPVHYAEDAAHGSARTFSMGDNNKMNMQDLNWRLASYMDKVQALEAANETLKMQIKELLDRKSPSDLINLDRYLDTVNMLHSQITESQTAEAQTKLQLVSLMLVASDLSARLDAEQGQCVHLQANLRDLRLTGEQMWANTLPCLSRLVSSLTQELTELQAQHLQDVQGLRARVSGEISMQLSCAESTKLSEQLEIFRESLNVMIDQKQAQSNYWFNTQASILTCKEEETPSSSSSEVFQTEMNNLRMTKLMLEEELTKLQTQKRMLEESDLSIIDGYSMQLAQLQQRADGLALQLSSVRQATSEQAEEYQALLHIKSGLEREIEDYTRLLNMKHYRTLSSNYQTMTSAIPLNVKTSGTAFESIAMMAHDRRIGAQTRTLWNESELKAQESRVHLPTTNHLGPVDPRSALHISVSPSTQTSICPQQMKLPEDAPRTYSTSVTSIGTSDLLDRSLTSSENKIQSITKESKGTHTGSQEGEPKIASLEVKEQSILLESQVQSLQTPTKNTVIVEPRGVQEINRTTQMTKQVTNTITDVVVKNTNIQHTITNATQPETHIISDCLIPTIPVIERLLEKDHDISPELSITSCDMQISERSRCQVNVCQIDSVVLQATITTGTAHTDILVEPTVVDLNISAAQRVASIERPTEEEIHVGNNTSCTVQGNTLDIRQKSQSMEITAVGNHLEKTIQENTDGYALGQAQSSLDEAHVSTGVDVRVRLESKTYSTEDTSDQIPGTVDKVQVSTVTKVEDNRSHVRGNAEGVCLHSSVENKVDDSFAPLLASAVRIKEEAEDVDQSAITSHGSSDEIGSINHTPLSENNPIPEISDKCPIIENGEGAVELDNAVPQVQCIEFVEKTLHVKEVEKGLSPHYALVEVKMDEQEQEEGKEIEKVDTTLHAIENSLLSDLPKTIQQGDQVHTIVNVVCPNLDSEASVAVEVNQTDQKTVAFLVETETGMSSVETAVDCEETTKLNLSQTHPDLSLSPEDTELCLSPNKTVVCSSATTPGVSEVKFVTTRDSDSLLNQIDPHTSLSQKEPGPVETNDAEVIDQNELDTCFSPVDCDVMTQNEFDTCFSPVDTGNMTQNELEMCLSSVNQDILNENELEACMPVDNGDIMSPNQIETCVSPIDNNDILSQNELEGCFSHDNNDILSPNEAETCFSPVDNDILSPNRSEACLSPDTDKTGYINREECFSPSDDVCMSPPEERSCSPVQKYLLTTKVDNQSLAFSGNLNLKEKDKASKVSEPPKEGNCFRKVLSSGYKFISQMDAGSNKSIRGIGQDAFSPVGSPPDNRSRKLSLGDREDTRFHSITRTSRSPSSNTSLDGQTDSGLASTRISSGSSLTNERSHCFRSVPTKGASFSSSTSNTEAAKGNVESVPAVKNNRPTSPGGRIFSGGSGEFKLYGGSVGCTSNAGSPSGGSIGSGGRLARSRSGDRISNGTSSKVISSSRRYGSVGSGESKPVYSSASGRISGVVRQSGVPRGTRAPSPGTGWKLGSSTGGSGGRLSSPFGGSRTSTGSAGKHSQSGSNDRLSGGQVLKVSSAAGQVRSNSTGGRVISSSDRPGSSVGSGVGANKERISVCKRAALSISAAGRERSQEKHRSTQRMASAKSIQHWVTTGVGGTVEDLDDQDDILNL